MIYDRMLSAGKFLLRADAEEDMTFQQIIPYLVIKTEQQEYLVLKRIAGEERLKGTLSLGVGGHINPCDKSSNMKEMIQKGLMRELKEEIRISGVHNIRVYGTIRDLKSSTPDHIGIVFLLCLPEEAKGKIRVRERRKMQGMWMTLREMISNLRHFESWAQMIVANEAAQKKMI